MPVEPLIEKLSASGEELSCKNKSVFYFFFNCELLYFRTSRLRVAFKENSKRKNNRPPVTAATVAIAEICTVYDIG